MRFLPSICCRWCLKFGTESNWSSFSSLLFFSSFQDSERYAAIKQVRGFFHFSLVSSGSPSRKGRNWWLQQIEMKMNTQENCRWFIHHYIFTDPVLNRWFPSNCTTDNHPERGYLLSFLPLFNLAIFPSNQPTGRVEWRTKQSSHIPWHAFCCILFYNLLLPSGERIEIFPIIARPYNYSNHYRYYYYHYASQRI